MTEEIKEEINKSEVPLPETDEKQETLSETGQQEGNLSEIELPNELDQLKAQLNGEKDKYLRLAAEFDNYKKRNAKELREILKIAGQDIMRELLPVLDDLKRARNAFEHDQDYESLAKGLLLIKDKLNKLLQHKGLKEIESIGKDFDVQFHEAIAEIPAATEEQKGKIVDEVESGYTLNGSIIRHAKVVVGK